MSLSIFATAVLALAANTLSADIFSRGTNGYDAGTPAGIINQHDLILHREFYSGSQQNPFNMVDIYAGVLTPGQAIEYIPYEPAGQRPTPVVVIPPPEPVKLTVWGDGKPQCSPWMGCGQPSQQPGPFPNDPVSATPEPSTWIMFVSAVIMLLLWRRIMRHRVQ